MRGEMCDGEDSSQKESPGLWGSSPYLRREGLEEGSRHEDLDLVVRLQVMGRLWQNQYRELLDG
jgi:hypothetical protein